MKKKFIMLLITLFIPINALAYSNRIIPGGNTIGINVETNGVMVVGFYKINGKYNKGNPSLKEGDYIVKVDNIDVKTNNDLLNYIENNKDKDFITITYKRNNKEHESNINLIEVDGVKKTGLYIKDKISGIGTLSYIDPESNVYGALGHEIEESSSKKYVDINGGSIFKNIVTSIERSVNGSPGSKNAKFFINNKYGDIKKNTKYGIFGIYDKSYSNSNALELKKLNEINIGKAYIRTVTNGEEIKDYEINITGINKENKLKSISFEVTDEELLNKTGGIVQGMSGSPIIQDGYLVGVVTHVVVDDVKKGYGVSIITMLNEGDKLIEE